jgi:hypothetical protein
LAPTVSVIKGRDEGRNKKGGWNGEGGPSKRRAKVRKV